MVWGNKIEKCHEDEDEENHAQLIHLLKEKKKKQTLNDAYVAKANNTVNKAIKKITSLLLHTPQK